MLEILKKELRVAMILTGCSDVRCATTNLLLKDDARDRGQLRPVSASQRTNRDLYSVGCRSLSTIAMRGTNKWASEGTVKANK
jgi:hypothetical protein